MTRARIHRRGSAAVTAVTILALVAVTIAAMGSLFAAEVRRTRDAASEAQLRQLLVAGASAVGERVGAGQSLADETTIELPPTLAAEGARLVIRPVTPPDANTLLIEADANFGDREMSQTIRYVRRDGRWQLAGATLAS